MYVRNLSHVIRGPAQQFLTSFNTRRNFYLNRFVGEKQNLQDIIDNSSIEAEFKGKAREILQNNFITTLDQWKTLSSDKKRLFPVMLVEVLDSAAGAGTLSFEQKVEQLQKLITIKKVPDARVKSMMFKSFEYREESIIKVIHALGNNYSSFEANKTSATNKQRHSFITTVGGSGSGKTRAACEVVRIATKAAQKGQVSPHFAHTTEVFVDFSNGNSLVRGESDNPANYIGVRIFAAALREEKVARMSNTIGVDNYIKLTEQGVFNIDIVLFVIGKEYRRMLNIADQVPLPISLVLDEFQNTMKDLPTTWKKCLHSIAEYMCNTQKANEMLVRDNLIIIPTVAGTLLYDDVSFNATDYSSILMTLPSFPMKIVIKLVKEEQISKDQEIMEQLVSGKELRRFWYLMGIIPRNLEVAVRHAKALLDTPDFKNTQIIGNKENMFVEQLFTLVTQDIINMYNFQTLNYTKNGDRDRELLSITLSALKSNVEWLNTLKREGKIFSTLEGPIYLPHVVLYILNEKFHIIPKDHLHTLACNFSWMNFEQLHLHLLVNRINYLFETKDALTIEKIFPGAYGKNLLNKPLKISQKVEYAQETMEYIDNNLHVVPFKQITIDSDQQPIVNQTEIEKYVLQAPLNHASVDARWITKKYAFFIQYKYTSRPKTDHEQDMSPLQWYDNIYLKLRRAYPKRTVVMVFVTNANIPKKAKEAIDKHPYSLLVIDASVIQKHFPPNLLPYVSDKFELE
jgi:hypothetical protein